MQIIPIFIVACNFYSFKFKQLGTSDNLAYLQCYQSLLDCKYHTGLIDECVIELKEL